MDHATVFTIDESQAIRLPKAVALPENVKRVRIVKLGQARLITPADAVWDSFFDGPRASDDFMSERAQPPMQEREGMQVLRYMLDWMVEHGYAAWIADFDRA